MARVNSRCSMKIFSQVEETSIEIISQICKNIQSTKHKKQHDSTFQNSKIPQSTDSAKATECKEVFICIHHSSRMCIDQTGKFPYVARSGNQYLMIAYVVDLNLILAKVFKKKTKEDLTATYLNIKHELNKRGIKASLYILDNEASNLYKEAIEREQCTY